MLVPVIDAMFLIASEHFDDAPPSMPSGGPESSLAVSDLLAVPTWVEDGQVEVVIDYFDREPPASLLKVNPSWDVSVQLRVESTGPLRVLTTEFAPVDPEDWLTPDGGSHSFLIRARSRETAHRIGNIDPDYGALEQYGIFIWPYST